MQYLNRKYNNNRVFLFSNLNLMTILNCLGLKKLYKLDTSTSIHCKSFNKKLLTFLFIEPYITKQENSRLLYHIPTARGWVVPIFGPK